MQKAHLMRFEMQRKLLIVVAMNIIFTQMLFSDMPMGSGMGGQGMNGQEIGGGSPRQGGGRHDSSSSQDKKQPFVVFVSTNNVEDLLSFANKVGLTSQQIISIHMINADAQQDAVDKSKNVLTCQMEFNKSLAQIKPDFVYIHAMLKALVDAEAIVQAVPIDAYEKAYALLTERPEDKVDIFPRGTTARN